MLEVSLSRHTCATHVVLNDEHWNAFVFWYHNGTKHTMSCEDHVVPSSRTQINPSRSNTHTRILYEAGLSLGMNQWERDRDSLAMNELGSNKCLITARESGFLQDLPQGAFLFGFIQEESNCLLKIR
ncbi:MAG: hypothetical protein QOH70_1665 [Blastocatellia bacterium]|nr:hypothetical protein [Blastocatellia bacterium]